MRYIAKQSWCGRLMMGTACVLSVAMAKPSHAYEYTFDDGIKVQIQNTFQYSVLQRLAGVAPYFANVGRLIAATNRL